MNIMNIRQTNLPNNLEDINAFDLLAHLGITANNQTKNETFFDQLFLQGKYADYQNYLQDNFNPSISNFVQQKIIISSLDMLKE